MDLVTLGFIGTLNGRRVPELGHGGEHIQDIVWSHQLSCADWQKLVCKGPVAVFKAPYSGRDTLCWWRHEDNKVSHWAI